MYSLNGLTLQTNISHMDGARGLCCAFCGAVNRVWAATELKRQGQYSACRLVALKTYSDETSLLHAIFVAFVLTPLPSLAVIVLLEVVALNPPESGLEHNHGFMMRAVATIFILTVCLLQQTATQVGPAFSSQILRVVLVSAVIAVASIGIVYGAAAKVGFPVPFTIQCTVPTQIAFQGLGLAAAWKLYGTSSPERWRSIIRAIRFPLSQFLLVFTYPVYYHGFTLLPEANLLLQTVYWCLLPILKLGVRQLFFYLGRQGGHGVELRPLLTVFNADVVSALFVTLCVQFNPSMTVVAAIAAFKVAQAIIALQKVRTIGFELQAVRNNARGCHDSHALNQVAPIPLSSTQHLVAIQCMTLLDEVTNIAEMYNMFKDDANWNQNRLVQSRDTRKISDSKVLRPIPKRPADQRIEREYAVATMKMLFLIEFVVLAEFVEIILPAIYCT